MNTYVKIVTTLILALGLTLTYSFLMKRGYRKYDIHKEVRIKEIFEGTTAYDVIFLGSSRTHSTIYPKVVDSVSGLNSYNGGVEGGNLFEFKMTLDGYLANHPAPKLLVLTLDPFSFDVTKKIFFTPQYFSHLNSPVVRRGFKEMKEYNPFSLYSFLNIIYYDDYIKGLSVKGWMGQTELTISGSFQDKGFLSNGYKCVSAEADSIYKPRALIISKEGLDYLAAIMDTCKKRGIGLMFTHAPEYQFKLQKNFTNFSAFVSTVQDICKKNSMHFYRDDSLALCNNPCYFANYGHVNTPGAIEYSKILGERIKELNIKRN